MEKGIVELNSFFTSEFNIKKHDIRTYSPLTLAYIGDAVYELLIRTLIVNQTNAPVNKLHKKSSNLVKAQAQAEILQKILEYLTEEEMTFYKRGRNAKSYTVAKNASMSDYRIATGFETLMGYLYMSEQTKRLTELVKIGIGETFTL